MKKSFKLVAVLLVLTLIMNAFVACSKKKEEKDTSADINTTSDATDKTTADDADSNSNAESGDKPVLKVLVVTHSWTKDMDQIPMFTKLAEDVGVTIEWEQIRSGWDEKKNVLLASGEVPDIFIGAINDNDIAAFPDVFMPMNDLIDQYAPNIQRMFTEQPNTKSLATSLDGNIYGLVSVIPHRPSSFNIFSINKIWLDKLGLAQPTTLDEFYNVLTAFKTQDPNGNGIADEIPFDWAPSRGLFTAMSMIGAYGNYAEDFSGDWLAAKEGKVVFLPNTDDYKQLVTYLHKLYAEGLINQEVFTQDYSQFQARSKDPEYATVGATMGWSIEDRFGTQWKDQYVVQLPLASDSNIKPIWPANEMRTKYLTNKAQITSSCTNTEAAMRWLDGFYSEDMSAQGYYGSFDLCVKKDGNTYTILEPQDGMGADEWKWTNALVDQGLMYVSPDLESRIIAPASITERVEQDALYKPYMPNENSILPILKFSAEESSELSIIKADIYNVVDSYWAKWIAEGGIESEWDSYVEQLSDLGVEDMIKTYQNSYDDYLNK